MWSFGTTMTMAKDRDHSPASSASSASSTQEQSPPPSQSQSLQNTTPPPEPLTPILSQRSLKQLGLFFAGGAFLGLSILITRRAVARKLKATVPDFYQQSNRPVKNIQSDNSLIAVEALNLATLNVMGFGIMATGGLAWAFDISSVDDLRRKARRHIGTAAGGYTDEESEREIEEWVASVLLRKDKKERDANSPPKKDD
ncbi:hypothetical protein GGS26DRAFT_551714 [Hypomontagnella submonticulosa]|nr:hypothetical protein GGS26DRAFT_551714 [Hypomontagnella submonticulosa]